MYLSTTNPTISQSTNTVSESKSSTFSANFTTPKKHSLWADIKEDKAIQGMLVVVATVIFANISVFL